MKERSFIWREIAKVIRNLLHRAEPVRQQMSAAPTASPKRSRWPDHDITDEGLPRG